MTTVVLLPGLGRGPDDYDALAVHLRGAGHDVRPWDPVPPLATPRPGITLHDIAADVAATLDAPVHLIGHAFGNRVARCLAADRPDLVLSVTLLAAGGLVPPDPAAQRSLRTDFGPPNAAAPEQMAAAQNTPIEDWWLGGSAPLLVIQGLADVVAVPENGRRLLSEVGDRARLVEIEGATHALLLTHADAIAQAVLPFLASPTT